MTADELRSLQAPLKAQYRDRPETALVTLRAEGRLGENMWNGVPTFIGKGKTGIALFPATQEPKTSTQREIRMLHLAFRANHKNFRAAQRELEKHGIKFEFQDHEIAHSIYFRDPDGHQLEITTYEVD